MFEQRNRKLFVMGRVFWIIVLCCALTGPVFAHHDDERETPNLQGTWRVTLLPGAPNQFFSLMEFNKGGTMTEEASSARPYHVHWGVEKDPWSQELRRHIRAVPGQRWGRSP